MKIAMYCPTFYPSIGGTEEAVFQLSRALTTKGNQVVVYTIDIEMGRYIKMDAPSQEVIDGIFIRRYPATKCAIWGFKPQFISKKLVDEISQSKADIFHVHGFWQFLLLLSVVSNVKIPLVYTPLGLQGVLKRATFKTLLLRWTSRKICKKVAKVIALSQQDIDLLKGLGFARSKIVEIPSGVDYDRFSQVINKPKKDLILSVVTRYEEGKGTHVLIKTAKQVIKKYPAAIFLILGRPCEKRYYERLKRDIEGFEQNIRLIGPTVGKELLCYFSKAKLFVLPSIREQFGIVNLEAMAAGVPVISTDVGGISSYLRNDLNGILIRPNDTNELTNAIIRLMNDNKKRNLFIKNGKETAERYKWDKIAKQTIDVYNETLKL